MFRLAALAVLLATLRAGSLPAQPPGGLIGGIVRNAWSKASLRRAVVTLSTTQDGIALAAVAYSDPNGIFGFTGVPPGEYFLCVDYPAYQRACLGAMTQDKPAHSIVLAPGQRKNDIVFAMLPLGSVSGTVTDSDGDPLPNTSVQMLRPIYSRRTLHWQNANGAATNERGEYRITFVEPGQYRLMATRQFQIANHIQPDVTYGQKPLEQLDATQFYPHSDTVDSAATLTLNPGNDLKAIDFSIAPIGKATIAGRVIPPPGMEGNEGLNVMVIPAADNIMNSNFGCGAGPPEYRFQCPPVPQGRYRFIAMVKVKDHTYRSSEIIEARGDSDDFSISLTPGSPLGGHLKLEGEGAQLHGPYRVRLTWGSDEPYFGEQPVAEVKPDGSYRFEDVVPGIWDIDVEPHPPGSYLKAMTYGEQDVLTEEMKLSAGERPPMNLVVSMNGAIVKGSIRLPETAAPGSTAQSPARAIVLLAPEGKFDNVLSFYAVRESDASGKFEFTGVTPGRYKIYAFDHMRYDEYWNPDFLKPYLAMEEAFDAGEGVRLDRQTTLIVRGPDGTP